jgi:hypothetical protein
MSPATLRVTMFIDVPVTDPLEQKEATVFATLSTQSGGRATTPVDVRELLGQSGEPSMWLRLWTTKDEAAASGEDGVWFVDAHKEGREFGKEAAVAHVVWFHGPRDERQSAADRRAGEERIWPATRDMEGLVENIVLLGPDNALTVLSFFTHAEHIEHAVRRIMSTELLSGEDPGLLGGPDRAETFAVGTPRKW